MVVKIDGRTCGCGRAGLPGGVRRPPLDGGARAAPLDDKGHHTKLFDIAEHKGKDHVTSGVIEKALREDDKMAERADGRGARHARRRMASAGNLLDVDAIVLGGGMGMRFGAQYLDEHQGRACGRTSSRYEPPRARRRRARATSAARSAPRCSSSRVAPSPPGTSTRIHAPNPSSSTASQLGRATRPVPSSWRATARRSCSSTAGPTAPTRGGCVLDGLARADRGRSPSTCPASGRRTGSTTATCCAQLDEFAAAVRRLRARREAREARRSSSGNSLGGVRRAAAGASASRRALAGVVADRAGRPGHAALVRRSIERDPVRAHARCAAGSGARGASCAPRSARAYRLLAFADQRRPPSGASSTRSPATTATRRASRAARDRRGGMLPELQRPVRPRAIACPVLLVWGDRDRLVSHRGAERVLDALPGTRVELLEGVRPLPADRGDRSACSSCCSSFPREPLARAA